MVHHGVDVPRSDQEGEARSSQNPEALGRPPVGLGDHPDAVAPAFQQAGDQGGAEGGMIHIGITGDEDEIELPPSPLERLFPG